MMQYDKLILNNLLDSYESSLLFRGENKVNINISFTFSNKTIPDYFNESSVAYEDIHACIRDLKNRKFICVIWRKGNENHIVQKLLLKEESIEEIYTYLNRNPKSIILERNIQLLVQLQNECKESICSLFIEYLLCRIRDGKTVKEYIDINETEMTKKIVKAIAGIEMNASECYIREFSISHFSDSKVFEKMLGTITKIFRRFDKHYEEMDCFDILAEYSIYHTPNFVYFKGSGILHYNSENINLKVFKNGIGISGDVLNSLQFYGCEKISTVITIENLTTFFRWTEDNSIIIYLGGYHNKVRRNLLKIIQSQIPNVSYMHFGDIDAGGFEIYEDLCQKTGIPFHTYNMDIQTLEKYNKYAKKLTTNDRKRIIYILKKNKDVLYKDVLFYMLNKNIKLEQECIGLELSES